MICEGCGKREATNIIAGGKEKGPYWELELCDECAGPPPEEMTEERFRAWMAEHPEYAVTREELDAALRKYGVTD